MKMSLCNTFRFFAVSTTIVLSIAGSPVPGLVSRQANIATKGINHDLEHQGSLTVELKSDVKRPSYINSLKSHDKKDDTNSITLGPGSTKVNVNKNSNQSVTITEKPNIRPNDEEKITPPALEAITEAILSSAAFNITLNQEAETKTFRNISTVHPPYVSKKNEKTNENKTDIKSQRNDSFNDNQIAISTDSHFTMELERPTQVTLMDIKEESTINTQVDTETSLPVIKKEDMNSAETTTSNKPTPLASNLTTPTWKKYTVIDRKRLPTITNDLTTLTDISTDKAETIETGSTIFEEPTTVTDKPEVMVKSETAQGRILLQDAITSDIPSLDKLKSDLLSFPKFTSKSDTETTRFLSIEENVTKTDTTTSAAQPFSSTYNSEPPNTVSSKRAGYLDLSAKNSTREDDIDLKPKGTESLQGPFDAATPDTQEESIDDKIEGRVESQSQLAEDAIKEELLKEEMLSDNEEISKRLRDEGKQIETGTPALPYTDTDNGTHFDDMLDEPPHAAFDENLSVKPINLDKTKNTMLYPVNPNYKPLKKIEVQPAKPFVRDPDDNSWRNESLSSLGIVFKPKNSSKPFTQVLKNKTETEWNNLPEKDMKSEVPDLRVRLEQIAQKRKSKKKKIDSFGNVFYTDYEESSSSEENTSTPQTEDPSLSTVSTTDVSTSDISIVTPIETTPVSSTIAPASEATDVPAFTTTAIPTEKTQTTSKMVPTKITTVKRPKMFNLFDYYETNDDEDIADYLNMAKIDLKKYTVPIHTTYTPYTSPPLSVLYTEAMAPYTQERKGTIQYFPPRTTKRPKKNKHNNIRNKINPLALTDTPKHVLPISYHKLTTLYDANLYLTQHTNGPDLTRLKDDSAPKNFDRNLYLTTPPLTTMPDDDFGVIGNDGGYNRPNYVIKHYKDYANEASYDRHGKHREYAFTEPPAHDLTVTDFIKPTTTDKTTATEEYDYESEFRKDLLDRFVANFNENSNRFKSDFPVVYNNSIVHGASYDDKDAAMSRAYFRRPYGDRDYRPLVREPYDPNCENVTVELSPAYELHYYVPEQEEKQEVEAKPVDLPARYRL